MREKQAAEEFATAMNVFDMLATLNAVATDAQQLSAHINALDTTQSIDSDAYYDCYVATLALILDAPEQYST